jgi:hypothetical protein
VTDRSQPHEHPAEPPVAQTEDELIDTGATPHCQRSDAREPVELEAPSAEHREHSQHSRRVDGGVHRSADRQEKPRGEGADRQRQGKERGRQRKTGKAIDDRRVDPDGSGQASSDPHDRHESESRTADHHKNRDTPPGTRSALGVPATTGRAPFAASVDLHASNRSGGTPRCAVPPEVDADWPTCPLMAPSALVPIGVRFDEWVCCSSLGCGFAVLTPLERHSRQAARLSASCRRG